ncbi:helix-turn-helix transcriptional regulator [Streptomyces lonarensis]|uniref:Helix-turn-helix domain-containing protein n=1 Tax=Streptomyces lonarensis TaxID=700599 RepID=A0A7X6HY89_9ACTN|nr:helix-turn-helix transcriptional regulator [Streptomyces lonarensis]NJQ05351.1 helix-turn-helix domain-containing protein [Streptomyces lonarensis]
MDRDALADFLRRRREALRPEDVGLPPGVRRRTSGLRREEVAHLAVMSVDYYTRLEQRRGPQPSARLLSGLARSLRLSNDERDHLYRLAGHHAPAATDGPAGVAPGLLRVLESLGDSPGLVLTDLGVTLAQNRMAVALLGDTARFSGPARSAIHRWFMDPAERARYPENDRDRQSRAQVANLRVAHSVHGPRSQADALVRLLRRESSEFAGLWERHEVARRFADRKTLLHPEVGAIELDCQVLFTEDRAQTLLVFTAEPRTEAHGKLQLLSVLGADSYSPAAGSPGARAQEW